MAQAVLAAGEYKRLSLSLRLATRGDNLRGESLFIYSSSRMEKRLDEPPRYKKAREKKGKSGHSPRSPPNLQECGSKVARPTPRAKPFLPGYDKSHLKWLFCKNLCVRSVSHCIFKAILFSRLLSHDSLRDFKFCTGDWKEESTEGSAI